MTLKVCGENKKKNGSNFHKKCEKNKFPRKQKFIFFSFLCDFLKKKEPSSIQREFLKESSDKNQKAFCRGREMFSKENQS